MPRKGAGPVVSANEDLGAILETEARLAAMLARVEEESRALLAHAEERVVIMERESTARDHAAREAAVAQESARTSAELGSLARELAATTARWHQVAASEVPALVEVVLTRLVASGGKDGAR